MIQCFLGVLRDCCWCHTHFCDFTSVVAELGKRALLIEERDKGVVKTEGEG